ncbi:MAG: fasciclin domain-containing protein [Paracoccaceae bacterium]
MSNTLHDIVDTAVAAGTFKTLVAAVTAADLGATLKGEGPFTVFAPNDDACAKLPAGTVEELVKPENKAKLTAILTYHVMAGKVMAADIAGKKLEPATVNGQALHVGATTGVTVNGSTVVAADIDCTNGVIHVIDAVLMPTE